MAEREKITARIREIAAKPNNVTMSDIEWVVGQLQQYHTCSDRKVRHGVMYQVANRTFQVNPHTGKKQVKGYSVKSFLAAMIDLGWFEEE